MPRSGGPKFAQVAAQADLAALPQHEKGAPLTSSGAVLLPLELESKAAVGRADEPHLGSWHDDHLATLEIGIEVLPR